MEGLLQKQGATGAGGYYGPVLDAVNQGLHLFRVVAAQPVVEGVQFESLYPVQYAEHRFQIRQVRIEGPAKVMTPGIVVGLKLKPAAFK